MIFGNRFIFCKYLKIENKLKTINYTYFYRAAAATPEGGTACPGFTMTHMSPDTPPTDSFLVRPY